MQMIHTEQQWFNLRQWWAINKHACCHHSIAKRNHHAHLDNDTCPSLSNDLKNYTRISYRYQPHHKRYKQTQDQKIIAQVLSRVTGFARCLGQNGSIQSNDNTISSWTDCSATVTDLFDSRSNGTRVLISFRNSLARERPGWSIPWSFSVSLPLILDT